MTDLYLWKIPNERQSSIVGGLAGAVELKSLPDQYFDTVRGDLHSFENESYEMETGAKGMKCAKPAPQSKTLIFSI